jgi:hypothetical protein
MFLINYFRSGTSYQRNKKYSTMIKNLEELYQKERDNCNKLAKKYNEKEKEKEKKVSVPGFQVSITTHKNKKKLTVNDCLALNKEIKLDDSELEEKFKRLSVPDNYKNKVSRVYAKSSDMNQTIQKESKTQEKL